MSIENDGTSVLQTMINVESGTPILDTTEKIFDFFELKKVLEICFPNESKSTVFKRIGLQFPNNLLKYSAKVKKILDGKINNIEIKEGEKVKFFVLGDNIQGSCCPDILNCEHMDCDYLVKFGKLSCLNKIEISIPKRKLTVLHIFGKRSSAFNVKKCQEEIIKMAKETDKKVLIAYDLNYNDIIRNEIKEAVTKEAQNIVVAEVKKDRILQIIDTNKKEKEKENSQKEKELFGLSFPKMEEIEQIFYIGEHANTIKCSQFVMDLGIRKFNFYDALNNKIDEDISSSVITKGNRLLKKRYYLMNLVKCSNVFGIVVSTFTKKNYQKMVDYCKKLIKSMGKKVYVFYISKINPEKLAMFTEIDVWVLINCPNNIIVDSRDYYKPVVTPYEFYIGLNNKDWTGKFISDFNEILEVSKDDKPSDKDDDEMEFSFIMNKMVPRKNTTEDESLILEKREWKGIEEHHLDEAEVDGIKGGQDGIGEDYKLIEK